MKANGNVVKHIDRLRDSLERIRALGFLLWEPSDPPDAQTIATVGRMLHELAVDAQASSDVVLKQLERSLRPAA